MIGEIGKGSIRRGLGLCGDRQQLLGLWVAARREPRRFFQHYVRVCAADAQRRDSGAPGRSVGSGQSVSWLLTKNGLSFNSMCGFRF